MAIFKKRDLDVASTSRQSELDMADYNREISEMIRSGQYFQDGMRWFDEKYHAPIMDKAYSVVVTIIALVATAFAVIGLVRFLPITQPVTMVFKVADTDNKFYNLQMLADRFQATNYAYLKYFVSEYVIKRESYNIGSLEPDILRVRAQSTPEAFTEYRKYLEPSNPNSPIARFERYGKRSIVINKSVFVPNDFDAEKIIPAQATIFFTATSRDRTGEEVKKMKATIDFDYVPLKVNQENYEITPMEFKVKGYKVEPVMDNAAVQK